MDPVILKRTTSEDADFHMLVALLDRDLEAKNGAEQSFFNQFNKIDKIRHVVLAYVNELPVGCGAFKEYDVNTVEIKRMFVKGENRGRGIAAAILKDLELWAASLNYTGCILETGKKQIEAINLYQKSGYNVIPNYGQYENVERSICMLKLLTK
ncbi:MAG TPA: GNAT family N-acetyltransferase [Bacteroidia bacterium]|nr:GNAT family N-acetyltransferase [Bacteroidia bacterium]